MGKPNKIPGKFQHTATRRWLPFGFRRSCTACWFQHTATRRWLPKPSTPRKACGLFQHTATRRWLRLPHTNRHNWRRFQHTATRRWLQPNPASGWLSGFVSTHSHPKVAAPGTREGVPKKEVSTHSHPKVAANTLGDSVGIDYVSTHSHPKVAAQTVFSAYRLLEVSTHSHPKVAATGSGRRCFCRCGFNTQPPEGGCGIRQSCFLNSTSFQHTATRRWLPARLRTLFHSRKVSTHSHPKVAAPIALPLSIPAWGFNTQPPEGGCISGSLIYCLAACFNTQPPEGGCAGARRAAVGTRGFNTQPPEGGCGVRSTASPDSTRFQHTATRRWLPGKH